LIYTDAVGRAEAKPVEKKNMVGQGRFRRGRRRRFPAGISTHDSGPDGAIQAMNNGKRKLTEAKLVRCLIVIAGIILGQGVLYGPSLVGQKILLPLDILAEPGVYIPPTPGTAAMVPHNTVLSDLVFVLEPARRFAVSEIHHGHFPMWAPYQYGGVPFIWPKFSLFLLLECCTKSPTILAWVQLFAALVGGAGMFFFCRKSLNVGFWPATVCAWCYPLTAFFVLWQGYSTALAVYWLPWIFLAVDKTVRGESPLAPIGLSIVTFLVLTSGQIDISGQVLLGSGIYAIWCLWNTYPGEWYRRKSRSAIAMLILGWGLGFMLAAPQILPLVEYSKTGSRMIHRSAGTEERPPVGLAALPQVLLPDIYGTTEKDSAFLAPAPEGNLLESAAAAYTGVLATLLVAPLAWCNRRYRAMNLLWLFLAFLGLSWCLDVPGFVEVLRLPGLNMMSHNRLVFLTSFAILSMTAIGLENLLNGSTQRRWWFWLPAVWLVGLCGSCLYRSVVLPEPVATQLGLAVSHGKYFGQIRDMEDVWRIQAWFIRHYTVMAAFCLLGFAGWLLVWFQGTKRFRWFPVLAIFLVGELLWFGYGRSAQCDPALYYPRIPVLNQVARSVPGRVIGVNCLPAPIAVMQGLSDIRGYDAVDPARMVDLLKTAAAPGEEPSYAVVQYLVPKGVIHPPDTIQLAPVLDMLGLRYLILQGVPPPNLHPAFQGNGYWVLVNSNALPRVFVPKSVETVSNDREELEKLTSPQFNPANVAYVETPVDLPAACRGVAQITNEIPTRVMISVRMETPGLVVLADNWDKGWRAYWNGRPMPALRTNYAIRGIMVPAGNGTLEFVYMPASLILGLWLAGFGGIILSGWLTGIAFGLYSNQA
jgi:hypothetical protein